MENETRGMLNLFWFQRWWKCILIHWNAAQYTVQSTHTLEDVFSMGNQRKNQNQQKNEFRWCEPKMMTAKKEALLMGFKWIFFSVRILYLYTYICICKGVYVYMCWGETERKRISVALALRCVVVTVTFLLLTCSSLRFLFFLFSLLLLLE